MCKISRWILAVCHLASNLTTYVYVLIGYQNLSYPYDPSSCLHVKDTCNGYVSQSPDLCGCSYPSPQTCVDVPTPVPRPMWVDYAVVSFAARGPRGHLPPLWPYNMGCHGTTRGPCEAVCGHQ